MENPAEGILARLAWVNVTLVLFNLIPAFPMDGGRVLRAFLAWRIGYVRATQVSATVGQVVAFGFGALGLFAGAPLLLFIALFVYLGAASEAHAVQMREIGRGMLVSEAMVTRFESLSPGAVLEDAVQLLIRTTQHEFPVVDGGGVLRGVLTRDALIRSLREAGPDAPVLEVMQRDVPLVGARQCLTDAMQLLQQGQPAIGVINGQNRLVGLVTSETVGEMMMIHAALPPGSWPGGPRNPWRRAAAPAP
jgi:stage IV sporulation protein FB